MSNADPAPAAFFPPALPLARPKEPGFFRREFTGRKLVFNVIWHGLHWFLFAYGWYLQATNARLAGLNTLRFSVWTSRGAGLVLGFDGALILLPMLRNIIRVLRPGLTWLMPLDENQWFHRQVAYQILTFTILHTTAHYVNFINVETRQVRPEAAYNIHYTEPAGITGHTMNLILFLMFTTSHHSIRQQCFEAFWYTHHLAFFFVICLYTHATGCFVRDSALPSFQKSFPFYSTEHCIGYETWRFTIWGGILYFGERVYREIRARRTTKMTRVLMHPSGAMEIQFQKPSFKYKSGQWLFMQVPEISHFQWHPFTISSAPDDPYISCHVRQVGDWTKALGERLGCTSKLASLLNTTANGKDELPPSKGGQGPQLTSGSEFTEVDPTAFGRALPTLRIDGPYGAPTEDVFRAEVAVLVGAGIGVTPFASILKNIWYKQRKGTLGALRKVEFIWICKDTGSFAWFQGLLKQIEDAQVDPNFLRVSVYLTQRLSEDAIYNIAINDVGAELDPLTRLRSRTQFGRPDWAALFSNLRVAIETGEYLPGRESTLNTKVSVFFCGPSVLAKAIKANAKANNSETVKFSFAKEHF